MFQLRKFNDLVEEMGSATKAHARLKAAGEVVRNGYYDHGALDALDYMPKVTNIGKSSKHFFTLSPTDGIGAIKEKVEAADLDLHRHLPATHSLQLRNKKLQLQTVKLYQRNYASNGRFAASFSVTGFLRDTAPEYYLCVCYEAEEEYANVWALNKPLLTAAHKRAVAAGGIHQKAPQFRVGKDHLDDLNGRMQVICRPDDNNILTTASQFGL